MPDHFETPPEDPIDLFTPWYEEAVKNELNDPEAMALATVDQDGMPDVRMVLFKEYGTTGFVFYSNNQSTKGQQLEKYPKAALCWYWKSLRRQIRMRGKVTRVPSKMVSAYFATRGRQSKIGAWASQQSRPLKNRNELVTRAQEYQKKFNDHDIPCPPYWAGWRLCPQNIEFWSARDARLHDRIVYNRTQNQKKWTHQRLFP